MRNILFEHELLRTINDFTVSNIRLDIRQFVACFNYFVLFYCTVYFFVVLLSVSNYLLIILDVKWPVNLLSVFDEIIVLSYASF